MSRWKKIIMCDECNWRKRTIQDSAFFAGVRTCPNCGQHDKWGDYFTLIVVEKIRYSDYRWYNPFTWNLFYYRDRHGEKLPEATNG